MTYSDVVLDHFESPRNIGSLDKSNPNVGTGIVGAPECGDVLKLQIEVKDGIIVDVKWKGFGCGSLIASSSIASEMIRGKTLEEVSKIENSQIVETASLPPIKVHCSVLAVDSLNAAIEDYRKKQNTLTSTT